MNRVFQNQRITHSSLIVAGWGLFMIFNYIQSFLAFSILAFTLLIYQNRSVFTEIRPLGGYANWVTLVRLLILIFIGYNFINLPSYQIFILTLFALCLDGLDGYLARKYKMESEFGANLDGETDAFYVMLFCLLYFENKIFGFWILIIGLLPYIFVIVCYTLWGRIFSEPVSYFRKGMAVVIMGALLAPLLMPHDIYFPIVVIASLAVASSFFISFKYQWNNNT